eukprot:4016452-Pyramimonas_sp.AAC.1
MTYAPNQLPTGCVGRAQKGELCRLFIHFAGRRKASCAVSPAVMEAFARGVCHLLQADWLSLAQDFRDIGIAPAHRYERFNTVTNDFEECSAEEYAAGLQRAISGQTLRTAPRRSMPPGSSEPSPGGRYGWTVYGSLNGCYRWVISDGGAEY